jgi:epoxyqueuosine reductase QueG
VEDLRHLLLSHGAVRVGVADLTLVPPADRHHLPRGVSFAVPLEPHIVEGLAEGPTPEYAREYARANRKLNELADLGAAELTRRGHRAIGMLPTMAGAEINLNPDHLPHKTVARLAGLGWIGKCALLVTEEYGSAVRLGTVLTDAPLPVDRPVDQSRCGECMSCTDHCPAEAVRGTMWKLGLPRHTYYDARACYEHIKTMRHQRGLSAHICGVCILKCPWTQRYLDRARAR